tara:strand:- start:349 stop:855 length:507 start_codon:yes stop_codon:yes gene_type:complete
MSVKEVSNNSIRLEDLSGNGWTQSHRDILKYVCFKTGMGVEESIQELKLYDGDYKKLIIKKEELKLVNIVMRQTDYDIDTAYSKLRESSGDYMKVISNYLRGGERKKEKGSNTIEKSKISTNQKIFREIRDFMDNAKTDNDASKEVELKNKFINHVTNTALNINTSKD